MNCKEEKAKEQLWVSDVKYMQIKCIAHSEMFQFELPFKLGVNN